MTNPAEILATPWKINGLTIKNRFVLSPMAVLQPTKEGHPSKQSTAFLVRRAKGGAGLLIVGGGAATERGFEEAPFQPLMRSDRDKFIPDLKRMVDEVHEAGAPIFMQIFPSFGAMGIPAPGRPTRAASPKPVHMGAPRLPEGFYIPGGRTNPTPTEVSKEEILEIQRETVAAVVRCKEAGFDGVEIGAHMRYYYSSFFSPRTNWRTDEYGGSAENRARVVTDTVKAIREAVGDDYPVGLRLCAGEHLPDGMDAAGFAEIAGTIHREAGLDYVALSDGHYESMDKNLRQESGALLEEGAADAFRAQLADVPIILSSTYEPDQMADAIESGKADATMLARQLLADPDYPNKVVEGRMGEITWCDHNNSCLRRLIFNVPVTCSKNPETGREAGTAARKATLPQNVLITLAGNKPLMGMADKMVKATAKKVDA